MSGECGPFIWPTRRRSENCHGPWQNWTARICHDPWQKFPGGITPTCSTRSRIPSSACGTRAPPSRRAGAGLSSSTGSKAISSAVKKAQTNFQKTLPALQSDLARETLKDPYSFEFLTIADDAAEQEIERGLVAHIRQFLIELGQAFAFFGQQYRFNVGGEDFYIDLLFYLVKLLSYIV